MNRIYLFEGTSQAAGADTLVVLLLAIMVTASERFAANKITDMPALGVHDFLLGYGLLLPLALNARGESSERATLAIALMSTASAQCMTGTVAEKRLVLAAESCLREMA